MSKKIKEDYSHSDSGVSGQYKTWFLDYASYVILERAVPAKLCNIRAGCACN